MKTDFVVSCSGWSDADGGITYQVSISSSQGSSDLPPLLSLENLVLNLPRGIVTVTISVSDVWGAATVSSANITVNAMSAQLSSDDVNQKTGDLILLGNSAGITAYIGAALQSLNTPTTARRNLLATKSAVDSLVGAQVAALGSDPCAKSDCQRINAQNLKGALASLSTAMDCGTAGKAFQVLDKLGSAMASSADGVNATTPGDVIDSISRVLAVGGSGLSKCNGAVNASAAYISKSVKRAIFASLNSALKSRVAGQPAISVSTDRIQSRAVRFTPGKLAGGIPTTPKCNFVLTNTFFDAIPSLSRLKANQTAMDVIVNEMADPFTDGVNTNRTFASSSCSLSFYNSGSNVPVSNLDTANLITLDIPLVPPTTGKFAGAADFILTSAARLLVQSDDTNSNWTRAGPEILVQVVPGTRTLRVRTPHLTTFTTEYDVNAPICGDGVVQTGEQCDDGKAPKGGDGCSATCQTELGYTCTGTPSVCTYAPTGSKPTLTSVAPTNLPVPGGYVVLTGSGIDSGAMCKWFTAANANGDLVTPASSSTTSLNCSTLTMPSGEIVQVAIVNSGGMPSDSKLAVEIYGKIRPTVSWSATLLSLIVKFDYSMTTTTTDCAAIFSTTTYAALGTSPVCSWVDAKTLSMTFGTGATLGTSDLVTFKLDITSDPTVSTTAVRLDTSYSYPTVFVAPTPQILLNGPSTIGSCNDATISAALSTGNAGRAWASVSWSFLTTVSSKLGNATVAQKTLDLFVNGTMLAAGTYNIQVRLTPWYSSQPSSATFTLTKVAAATPLVTISPNMAVSPSQAFTVSASAVASTCVATTGTTFLFYTWTVAQSCPTGQVCSQASVSGYTAAGSSVSFPAYAFALNNSNAQFLVTVTVKQGSGSTAAAAQAGNMTSSTASMTINVIMGTPIVTVVGGGRAIGAGSAVTNTITASVVDPNVKAGATSAGCPVSIVGWTCTSKSATDTAYAPCSFTVSATTASISVMGSQLTAGTSYIFTPSAKNCIGTATPAVSAVMVAVAGAPPVVSIAAPTNTLVDVSRRLVLAATVDQASATLQWTISTFSSVTPLLYAGATANTTTLILAASVLSPGKTYTVRLSATASGATGYSEISFTTNSAPSSGTFTVSPASGQALSDFTLTAKNWIDAEGNTPITYEFQYMDPFTGSCVRLGAAATTSLTAPLPAGNSSLANVLNLRLAVRDSLGATTYATTTVTVSTLTLDATAKSNIAKKLSSLSQDVGALSTYISAVGSSLNSLADSSDAMTLRDSLFTALSTSGSQVSASVGGVTSAMGSVGSVAAKVSQISNCGVSSGANFLSTISTSLLKVAGDSTLGSLTDDSIASLINTVSNLLAVNDAAGCSSRRSALTPAQSTALSLVSSIDTVSSTTGASMVVGEPTRTSSTTAYKLYTTKTTRSALSSAVVSDAIASVQANPTNVPTAATTVEFMVASFVTSQNPLSDPPFTNSGSKDLVSNGVIYSTVRTATASTAAATTFSSGPTLTFMSLPAIVSTSSDRAALGYSNGYMCVRWDSSNNVWTNNACSVASSTSSTVTCTCTSGNYFAVKVAEKDCAGTFGGSDQSCASSGIPNNNSWGLSGGAIAGIVIACVAFAFAAIGAGVFLYRRKLAQSPFLETPGTRMGVAEA